LTFWLGNETESSTHSSRNFPVVSDCTIESLTLKVKRALEICDPTFRKQASVFDGVEFIPQTVILSIGLLESISEPEDLFLLDPIGSLEVDDFLRLCMNCLLLILC
jgi:hypothetical protein